MKHHHHQQQQRHDDTTIPLISNARVIEYLVPTMSKGLLSMFPDNSSSSSSPCPDFYHSKSTIWSPLVPRHYVSSLDSYGGGNSRGRDRMTKKIQGCGGFELRLGSAKRKAKKRRSISSEDADAEAKHGGCGCIPFSGKGWNKMMKAASRQFKRRKMMRKNSTVIRVKKLSNSKLDLLVN